MFDLSKVTRVNLVDRINPDHTIEYHGVTAELYLQDDGRTLKIFIKPHPDVSKEEVDEQIAAGLVNWLEGFYG